MHHTLSTPFTRTTTESHANGADRANINESTTRTKGMEKKKERKREFNLVQVTRVKIKCLHLFVTSAKLVCEIGRQII